MKLNKEDNEVKLHPRARVFAHVIITIFFLGLVFVAMLYLSGYRDTVYNYTPIDHANETFGFVKNVDTGQLVPLRLDYYVHLSTTSLSAQNKIDITAKAYEGRTFDHRLDHAWGTSALPNTMCLVFPNALPFEEQPNGVGGFYGVVIPLKEDTKNHWYYGEASIKYPFEGQNGYVFLDSNNTGLDNPKCDSTTPQPSNLYNTTKIKQSIQEDNKYLVGSASLTDALKTNDMTTALTLILIAFGFLEFRSIIRNGFVWLAEKRITKEKSGI